MLTNCLNTIGLFTILAFVSITSAYANSVVLWNKLGSDTEIINSEIGPGGEKTGGSFEPGPFPNFGQAYVNGDPGAFALTFPANSVVSKSKGTIEFWAKLNNFPSALFDYVSLFDSASSVHGPPYFGWRIGFGTNDGCAGGGLSVRAGVATDDYCTGLVETATKTFTQSSSLDSILGDRTAWHHYAMVWDEMGISQLGGKKVYLYLDGNLIATPYYLDGSPYGSIPSGSRFGLSFLYNITGASIAVDNLIIWDDVKTDFSDRFNENPIGKSFAAFISQAEIKFGPGTKDDSFKLTGYFKLATDSNGINPLVEAVAIQFGTFSTSIPSGSFQQDGQGFKYVDQVKHYGIWIQPQSGHSTGASIHPNRHQELGAYQITVRAHMLDLDGIVPPTVRLIIGDDQGQSKLDVGKAKFGKAEDDQQWVFPGSERGD